MYQRQLIVLQRVSAEDKVRNNKFAAMGCKKL